MGGPRRVQTVGPVKSRTEAIRDSSGSVAGQLTAHLRNFVACMKTRKTPVSDLESGHVEIADHSGGIM